MEDWSSLDDDEKQDVILILSAGALLGIGSIVFRVQSGRPTAGFSAGLFKLHYGLMFPWLSSLLLFRQRHRTLGGWFMAHGLLPGIGLGILLPAAGVGLLDLINFLLIGAVIFVGGLLFYKFRRPTNLPIIVLLAIIGVEFYLFGVAYSSIVAIDQGSIFFGLAVVLGTLLIAGYLRILWREYNESYAAA